MLGWARSWLTNAVLNEVTRSRIYNGIFDQHKPIVNLSRRQEARGQKELPTSAGFSKSEYMIASRQVIPSNGFH